MGGVYCTVSRQRKTLVAGHDLAALMHSPPCGRTGSVELGELAGSNRCGCRRSCWFRCRRGRWNGRGRGTGARGRQSGLVEGPTPVRIGAGYNFALERIVTFETVAGANAQVVYSEAKLFGRASLAADCSVLLHGQYDVGLGATAANVTAPFARLQPHAIQAIPQDYGRWFWHGCGSGRLISDKYFCR